MESLEDRESFERFLDSVMCEYKEYIPRRGLSDESDSL